MVATKTKYELKSESVLPDVRGNYVAAVYREIEGLSHVSRKMIDAPDLPVYAARLIREWLEFSELLIRTDSRYHEFAKDRELATASTKLTPAEEENFKFADFDAVLDFVNPRLSRTAEALEKISRDMSIFLAESEARSERIDRTQAETRVLLNGLIEGA